MQFSNNHSEQAIPLTVSRKTSFWKQRWSWEDFICLSKDLSSEGLKSQQADPDVVTSLLKLRDEMLEKKLDRIGYIQKVHAFPFSVHCYAEMGIRIYHYIGKQQAIFCDATGTIVSLRKQSHNTSGLLYYSIVLQHPCVKESPVAVAELISSEHTITAITFFRGF